MTMEIVLANRDSPEPNAMNANQIFLGKNVTHALMATMAQPHFAKVMCI